MSLNHSSYLRTLDSERRQVATFQSGTIQQQLDSLRQQVHLLLIAVELLIGYHNRQHGIDNTIESISDKPIEISASTNQPIKTTRPIPKSTDSPYN